MIKDIPIHENSPQIVYAIIEIPLNTHNKYEYDEKLDIIKLDRVLHSPMHYPVDYGFIPKTLSKDGDHLDIMIITNAPVFSGCLLEARPIGALIMSDEHGDDEKILAVPARNPNYNNITTLKDVPPHLLEELTHFFTEYKRLEHKNVTVGDWMDKEQAQKIINESYQSFLTT